MFNGDAHYSTLEDELRMDRWADCQRADNTMSSRILYVGNDLTLYNYLQDTLDMKVVRCVGHSDAQLLIKGIKYSAIVLDESAKDLEPFIRKLRNHKKTPVIFAGPPEEVSEKIKQSV